MSLLEGRPWRGYSQGIWRQFSIGVENTNSGIGHRLGRGIFHVHTKLLCSGEGRRCQHTIHRRLGQSETLGHSMDLGKAGRATITVPTLRQKWWVMALVSEQGFLGVQAVQGSCERRSRCDCCGGRAVSREPVFSQRANLRVQ